LGPILSVAGNRDGEAEERKKAPSMNGHNFIGGRPVHRTQ
jgi:hypothetical protein